MKLYKIKPLEWVHDELLKWTSKNILWKYMIRKSGGRYWLTIYKGFTANGVSGVFKTLEDAKQHCELDFKNKILEGLEEVVSNKCDDCKEEDCICDNDFVECKTPGHQAMKIGINEKCPDCGIAD